MHDAAVRAEDAAPLFITEAFVACTLCTIAVASNCDLHTQRVFVPRSNSRAFLLPSYCFVLPLLAHAAFTYPPLLAAYCYHCGPALLNLN